ncbi:hypothetical protein HNY73_016171 [Argiope bruennichi]|uniref:Uncharacterized protein n=1 Tax=Argiope bruennichi TaxID=94029 RepID=A0A8T0EJ62_ARGBR|nr:hypothetical protein HNY73_016171 [Argiope bruennichi]
MPAKHHRHLLPFAFNQGSQVTKAARDIDILCGEVPLLIQSLVIVVRGKMRQNCMRESSLSLFTDKLYFSSTIGISLCPNSFYLHMHIDSAI